MKTTAKFAPGGLGAGARVRNGAARRFSILIEAGPKGRTFPRPPTPGPWPLLFLLALTLPAAIIDRIAVSVGERVITTSDLDREIRVTAFLNGIKPDFSPATKRTTADRMIEQRLIEREVENGRYPAPLPESILPALEDFQKRFYPDPAAYQRALTEYGITDDDVRKQLLWQRTLLEVIDIRFRPTIQVTDEQIQDYFDKVVAPAAKAAHPGQTPSLADYRDKIEQTLVGQREDEQMDTWLRDARRRIEVVLHDEAFK